MRSKYIFILLVLLWPCLSHAGDAKEGIRDSEMEQFFTDLTTPLLEAANLNPADVTIHVLANSEPNAFVANGQNIFLHTGLLQMLTTPEQVSGVLAHEIGHIRGGHIVRAADTRRKDLATALISGALIGAAGVAAGGGEQTVAGALLGGVQTAQLSSAAYSRTQEASADQAGLQILRRANITAQGMPQVLNMLADKNGEQFTNTANMYVRSHPISAQRLRLLSEGLETDTAPPLSAAMHQRYNRLRGKLTGFLLPVEQARNAYAMNDASQAALYSRSVVAHREGRLTQALALLNTFSDVDPYAHELRGQFYYESGQLPQAVAAYRRAVALLPNNDLMAMQLAITLAALKQPASDHEALLILKKSLPNDAYEAGYRTAAQIAQRLNLTGEAVLFSAQEAWQRGDLPTARDLAARAKELLPPRSPQGYIADDMLRQTEAAQKAKDD